MKHKNINYFTFQGQNYYVGSMVKLKAISKSFEEILLNNDYVKIIAHIIIDDKKDMYIISFRDKWGKQCEWRIHEPAENFIDHVQVSNNTTPPKPQYYKDTEISDMFYGWVVYIAVMLVGSIFKGNIVIWLLASIIFFKWRKDKLFKGY